MPDLITLQLPREHYDTIVETLTLDSQSPAFDAGLRQEIETALASITELPPGRITVTIHALASDTRREGTSVDLYDSKADLHQAQRDIIESDLQNSGDESDTITEIRELLAQGEIEEAWELWENEVRDGMTDTYHIEEKTFDRSATVKIEVAGGVAECTHADPGIEVTIQDHDNEKNGH
jgi:hypothetical protein